MKIGFKNLKWRELFSNRGHRHLILDRIYWMNRIIVEFYKPIKSILLSRLRNAKRFNLGTQHLEMRLIHSPYWE